MTEKVTTAPGAFKKLVIPGTLEGSKLYVEIEWSGTRLSICGNHAGGAGQIDFDPAAVLCAPGWAPFDVARLKEIWDTWHLNDMNAGCSHQRALGWGTNKLELVSYGHYVKETKTYPGMGVVINKLKGWVREDPFKMLGFQFPDGKINMGGPATSFTDKSYWALIELLYHGNIEKPKNPDDPRVLWFAEKFNCQRKVEKKTDGWVYPTEHPEGKMCKPCPTCGYKYGSAWVHEDAPEDVIEWLAALPETETGGRSSYEVDADDFLEKHGIHFLALVKTNGKCPLWCDGKDHTHGIQHKIIFTRIGNSKEAFSLDFWNSMNDAAEGKAPTAYDVLAALTKSDPGSFENFCGEYGYDSDSRKAEKTHGLVVKEWEKVSAFFTEEELEEMQEIN